MSNLKLAITAKIKKSETKISGLQQKLAILLDMQNEVIFEALYEAFEYRIKETNNSISSEQQMISVLRNLLTEETPPLPEVVKVKRASTHRATNPQTHGHQQILEYLKSKHLHGVTALEVAKALKTTPGAVSWRLTDTLGYAAFSPAKDWAFEDLMVHLPKAPLSWLCQSAETAKAELDARLAASQL
jgi:hypothetical protein